MQQDRAHVEDLKEFCAKERERIYSRHQFGIGGKEIVGEYTRLTDNIIQRIFHAATQEKVLPEAPNLAILALGGYGREELNPYSDIDIMLVYDASRMNAKQIQPFASQLITVLWDAGFEVGHSCRSIKECIRATYDDIFSKTSMLDARYIAGSRPIYRKFRVHTSKHFFKRRVGKFIAQKIQEWNERHESYGASIYLQEPNIKESVGGLRDFHTAIWIAAVRYGIKDLPGLANRGMILETESDACETSLDFLWRLRNELHYVNQRRNDQLTFEVQETVAKNLGYRDKDHTLAEEDLMRDYYLHAEHLFEFSKLIIDRVKHNESKLFRLMNRMLTKRLPDGFAIVRNEISFQPGHSDFRNDPSRMMKVFVHRQQLNRRISAVIRQQIAANLNLIDDEFRRLLENAKCFLSILSYPTSVAEVLRRMHRWQVLDSYLPEFGKVRSLIRFDRYHQYTVDEHTMYAIENLDEGVLRDLKYGQTFLNILNGLKKPELLRLALLLHDVGKGVDGPIGGHDVRSVEMAKGALNRLGLNDVDQEMVLFLILRHREMSYTAQQRDVDDPREIERFAGLVKDEEHLKMLYLLTFADMRAVNPSIWNEWNSTLLSKLYARTLKFLEGKQDSLKFDELKAQVIRLIGSTVGGAEITQHFKLMPEQELISQTPELIGKQIQLVEQLKTDPVPVSCFEEMETYTQIGICTRDARGIFRGITGVLAAEDISILSAVVNTRKDGIVIDMLNVAVGRSDEAMRDISLHGISLNQCNKFAETLGAVWRGEKAVEELLKARGDSSFPAHLQRRSSPSEIRIDSTSSDYAIIVDIRVPDRVGLLYTISNVFYELDLGIRLAKVTTRAFTAIDSFYVTEEDGTKTTSPERIAAVKHTLAEALGHADIIQTTS